MPTLSQLLTHVGADLLDVTTTGGVDAPVTSVRVFDRLDTEAPRTGELVLGVGVDGGRDGVDLVETLGVAHAAGLVVRRTVDGETRLREAATRAGIALLGTPPSLTWADLLQLLQQALVLDAGGTTHPRLLADVPSDLSVIADELAALVDAPVLIQDVNTTVIAFSGGQESADTARAETVVRRRIPEDIVAELRSTGVIAQIERSRQPLYLERPAARVGPRLVVGIRAGDEVIGYVWAAVPRVPTPEQVRLFGQGASLASLHILRHRLTSDARRSLQSDLVAAALGGGPLATSALQRLGVPESAYRVAGVAIDAREERLELGLLQCLDLVSFHLRPLHAHAAAGLSNGALYAIVPVAVNRPGAAAALSAALGDFMRRARTALRVRVLVGLSSVALDASALVEAREEVDEILRVLRVRPDLRQPAQIGDVQLDGLILRIVEYCRAEPALTHGPLRALRDHDARHGTAYVETLRAHLEHVADPGAAAAALRIHPNTLRYRLKQVQRIAHIDLRDPDHVLIAHLQVRAQDRLGAPSQT